LILKLISLLVICYSLLIIIYFKTNPLLLNYILINSFPLLYRDTLDHSPLVKAFLIRRGVLEEEDQNSSSSAQTNNKSTSLSFPITLSQYTNRTLRTSSSHPLTILKMRSKAREREGFTKIIFIFPISHFFHFSFSILYSTSSVFHS